MTLIIPGGFGRYRHEFSLTGDLEPMNCIFGWKAEEGAVDLAVVALGIHNAGKALHGPNTIATTSMTKTVVELVPATGEPPLVAESISSQAGANAGEALTQNTTYLVKKTTAMGGRRGRGRNFWPGVRADQVSDAGVVLPATITAWNTALATYLAAVKAVAGVAEICIIHSFGADGEWSPTPVTGMSLDGRVASQRKRLRR